MANNNPSSDQRPSLVTRKSGGSSTHSRHSTSHIERGESSARPGSSSSGRHDGSNETASNRSSRYSGFSGSTEVEGLGNRVIEEVEERSGRWHRSSNRSSGGFLLDGAFGTLRSSHGPKERHDGKGKDILDGTRRHRSRKRDVVLNSPLSQEFGAVEEEPNELHVPKGRGDAEHYTHDEENVPTQPAIDPTQIVHMAPNLSESRRRKLSAGQLLAPTVPTGRRTTSAGGDSPMQGNNQNFGIGGTLRQYLQQQRHIPRSLSPQSGTPPTRRASAPHGPLSPGRAITVQEPLPDYEFSSATLARRDKARAAIELSVEYMRLLQFLPPLKPDSSVPANSAFSTTGIPGTANVQLNSVPSYSNRHQEFGRPYNPLQYIRNRKVRNRECRPLNPDSEEFEDVPRVKHWIDIVEARSREPGYQQDDKVNLPAYVPYRTDGGEHHDALNARKSRPRLDWTMSPADLLADAYWLEQGDNKCVIEDGHARRIFEVKRPPSFRSPRASKDIARSSKDIARASMEFFRDGDKRRSSHVETLSVPSEPKSGDESHSGSERGRKRRLFPTMHRDESSNHRKKHAWNLSRTRSSSSSGLSSSEEENASARKRSHKKRRSLGIENTGPLERHVQEMLEKEANMASPDVVSPDTPDKWGTEHSTLHNPSSINNNDGNKEQNSTKHNPEQAELPSAIPSPKLKHRPNAIRASNDISEPRSSFEDLDSTAPSTPVLGEFIPNIGMELSPPMTRRHSIKEKGKARRSKLGLFRSDGTKENHDSAVEEEDKTTHQAISEVIESPTKSANPVKHLLHRKNDSMGSIHGRPDSRGRKESKDSKEPGSSVSRFFKGGRIGELVRTGGGKVQDFIFRRDPPSDDSDAASAKSGTSSNSSSDSGTDDEEAAKKPRPANRSQTFKDLTYNRGNLPSFKSTHDTQVASDDPISRQQLAQRSESRPARFERLKPPSIDVNIITSGTARDRRSEDMRRPRNVRHDTEQTSRSTSESRQRLTSILDRPGLLNNDDMPVTSLSRLSPSHSPDPNGRSSSVSSANRHWSISDSPRPRGLSTATRTKDVPTDSLCAPAGIAPADIAHIRALLLSSGIKAYRIHTRASCVREEPPAFLKLVAETAGARLIEVNRKEGHVLAARFLCKDLEIRTRKVQEAIHAFQDPTVVGLEKELANLRARVEGEGSLTPRCHRLADTADEVIGVLSAGVPLRIKEVNERIDGMLRGRRRRMRWVRRVGWGVVEWGMVGVLWWVWAVVVVIRVVLGAFRGVGRGVKRFLWL